MTNGFTVTDQEINDAVSLARLLTTDHYKRVGKTIPWEEIYSAALYGIARVSRRYDPSRGKPFLALARVAMRGAIIDNCFAKERPYAKYTEVLPEVRPYGWDQALGLPLDYDKPIADPIIAKRIESALDSIADSGRREAARLHIREEWTYEEIATYHGLKGYIISGRMQTVKRIIKRRLKGILDEYRQ